MARARPPSRPIGALVAAAALCAAPGAARADGAGAQLEGNYSSASTKATDDTGHQTKLDQSTWTQRYRLSLDRTLFPYVRFSAGGLLDWMISSSDNAGAVTDTDSKKWDGNAHLSLGGPVLFGGLDYDRRQEAATSRAGGVTSAAPELVRESYSAAASWRPLDLPTLDLRLSRSDSHDAGRQRLDLTSDEVLLASRFEATPNVELRYSARYGNVADHIAGVRTTSVDNTANVTWTDRFLDGRGNAYVGYSLTTRNVGREVAGTTGTVATQRFPTAGFSTVEGPLDLPTKVTLKRNDALIDGVTTASAGVNLGYSAAPAGSLVTYRDLGAQLPNVVTRVNTIYVWMDRNAAAVAADFRWKACKSDDNDVWTCVDVDPLTVRFDPLQWRFEIPIDPTPARYVKVSTLPLVRPALPDPQLEELYVTELQLYEAVPAAEARGRTFDVSGALTGTTKITLLRSPALTYDASAVVTHSNRPLLITYSVVNGLSLQRPLGTRTTLMARADRTDSDAGAGHDALNRWTGSVSAELLPTLGGTIAYTGQLAQHPHSTVLSNSATAFARADLYEGVSASATTSASWAHDDVAGTTRGATASGSVSVVPNRVISTSGSGSYSYTVQTGGGRPDRTDRRGVLEAAASVSPFRALALSGSVTRLFSGATAATFLNFSGALSLFPGGDLQLRYLYQESLDTAAEQRTRSHGPGLRWNIRPGWFFNAAYTFQAASAPEQKQDGHAFNASLVITFR